MFVYPLTRSSHVAVQRAASTQDFNRAIDRLFDESTNRVSGRTRTDPSIRTPALDVAETDTTYRVLFDVPGANRDLLKVTIDGRRLNVETVEPATEAKTDGDATDKNPGDDKPAVVTAERVLYRERTAARYARTVVLPAEVEQTGSEARFENGVLSLTLVKKVPTGARQISIS